MESEMMKKKLLLHVCCAPCAVYVVEVLEADYEVTLFFYNPNIHPEKEYLFRRSELERIAKLKEWRVVYPGYDMREWFERHKGLKDEPERGKRCSLCFRMRLETAFAYAKAEGYDVVASTLSISPYKATRQINEQGERLSKEFGVAFLPENFKKRDGHNKAREMSRQLGIKHQTWCGCVYSLVDRKLRERRGEFGFSALLFLIILI